MSALHYSDAMGRDNVGPMMRLSILHVSDCPLVSKLRARAEAALEDAGLAALIEEVEGTYSSPTLLIDGIPLPGFPLVAYAACRIDLPTQHEIAAAIQAVNTNNALPAEGEPQ